MSRWGYASLAFGCVLAIGGAGLAVVPAGIGTLYWIGWGVLLIGILFVVAASESAA